MDLLDLYQRFRSYGYGYHMDDSLKPTEWDSFFV